MADPQADKIIEAYMLLREKRSVLKKAYDEEDSVLKANQEKLENWLLKKMEEVGTDQLKVSGIGTAFRQIKTRVSCSDWPSFWPKIAELGRWDFLQKRLSDKAIKDFMDDPANAEVALPGITTFNEFEVTVRKN
jgi:hypothetical protein